jgi:nucleoside-diphosphate-sugar epimerase
VVKRDMNAPKQIDKWVVLGASGFVGRSVVNELRARKHEVIGVDRVLGRSTGSDPDIFQMDVDDGDALRSLFVRERPTVLLNAIGHPANASESDLFRVYVDGTDHLLASIQAGIPSCRVILLGSASEYGNSPVDGRSRETDELCPLSPYGRAKCGQYEVACGFRAKGLDVITARLFNVIGPNQSPALLLGALLERIKKGENPLKVRDGNYVRDWIDVRDVADAVINFGTCSISPEVVNVCSGEGKSVAWVAASLAKLAGVGILPENGPISPSSLWRSVGDPGFMIRLGWRSRHLLEESVLDQFRDRFEVTPDSH